MRRTTVRELHLRTGALVNQAAEGHVILILKRGVPVAQLRPIDALFRRKGLPDREAFLAKLPRDPDSGKWLEKHRS